MRLGCRFGLAAPAFRLAALAGCPTIHIRISYFRFHIFDYYQCSFCHVSVGMFSKLPVWFLTETATMLKQVMPVLTAAAALLHVYAPCVPKRFFPAVNVQTCNQSPNHRMKPMRVVPVLERFSCNFGCHFEIAAWILRTLNI
jgi:hypothetical protein